MRDDASVREAVSCLARHKWIREEGRIPEALESLAVAALMRDHPEIPPQDCQRSLSRLMMCDRLHMRRAIMEKGGFEASGKKPFHAMQRRLESTVHGAFLVAERHDGEAFRDIVLVANGFPLCLVRVFDDEDSLDQGFDTFLPSLSRYGRMGSFIQLFVFTSLTETFCFSDLSCMRAEDAITWADEDKEPVPGFEGFCHAILQPCLLVELCCDYMMARRGDDGRDSAVIMLRPHQYHACRLMLERLDHHRPGEGKPPGGYISHATGSGKSITMLCMAMNVLNAHRFPGRPYDKVVIVVDRIDLLQQMTDCLRSFSEDPDCVPRSFLRTEQIDRKLRERSSAGGNIIVTMIGRVSRIASAPGRSRNIVFLFDEGHRSQAGEMNKSIRNGFPDSPFFAVTGTPIHLETSRGVHEVTRNIFGEEIHQYLLNHAVRDRNIVPFMIFNEGEENALDLTKPQDVVEVVDYIEANHAPLTQHGRFAAMLTTPRVDSMGAIYREILERKRQGRMDISIAASVSTSGRAKSTDSDEEEDLDAPEQEFMSRALAEYERQFGKFPPGMNPQAGGYRDYKRDVARRIRQGGAGSIDLLLVVGQFITGFDAPRVNTVYVIRDSKPHNTIQSISRANRPCGPEKVVANAVFFRMSRAKVEDALSIYCSTQIADLDKYAIVICYNEKVNQVRDRISKFLEAAEVAVRPPHGQDVLVQLRMASRLISKEIMELAHYSTFKENPPEMKIAEFEDMRRLIRSLTNDAPFQRPEIIPAPSPRGKGSLMDLATLEMLAQEADIERFRRHIEALSWKDPDFSPREAFTALMKGERRIRDIGKIPFEKILEMFLTRYRRERNSFIVHLGRKNGVQAKPLSGIILGSIQEARYPGLPDLKATWGADFEIVERLKLLGQVEYIHELVADRYPWLSQEDGA